MNNKAFLIITLSAIICSSIRAQKNKSIFINTGSSLTFRALDFEGLAYSNEEIAYIKKVETTKPSFSLQLGYTFDVTENIYLQFGAGYRHTRFGTKIFSLPDTTHNTTSQYGRRKQVIMQGQQFLFVEAAQKYFSVKFNFIRNNLYKIYRPTYDENGSKAITGKHSSPHFLSQRFDLNIEAGSPIFFYTKNNRQIIIKPFVSFFVKKYTVLGNFNQYLFFQKNTTGHLWDVGINLQYNFMKNKQ